MTRLSTVTKQLQRFIASGSSLEVIYHTHTPTVSPVTQRLCILDSSFNPPHLGHFSLVEKSVKNSYPVTGVLPYDEIGVVLMFSVENCDKKVPKPAAFEHRLSMMCLLADEIKKNLDVPVFVTLTNKPIFADKSLLVQDWIKNTVDGVLEKVKLTFLLGYDTLIRVFDNKYYRPTPTVVALDEFMSKTDLFALTRDDDSQHTADEQMEYLAKIKRGEDPECRKEWGEQIFLVEGEPDFLDISSSNIRKSIEMGSQKWSALTFESIADYIRQCKPYTEDSTS
ncbi:CYFA0S06e03466g1_1 [Cyberlindnera fabianii]|uniref:CYFA0S06e03466g1_1 n=1 Tax=Cyberlindnera fabianii TaxID=36022 RepID=A0A061B0L3_CYBFA|nr:Nicotinamide mononucleotide adenylyltransferase [Cyberlindnera fabianii]CDR41187.1 CYFA0S06e03466g1_1 [Cyberlindnera fabianii]